MIKEIKHKGKLLALIVSNKYHKEGISFFTPNEFSQQLAYMKRAKGYKITPHVHKPVPRRVEFTLEVLFIRRGKVKMELYSEDKKYLKSVILRTGDVVLLAHGGHGFTMLEPTEIIEVKQGPYAGTEDKEKFAGR